MNDSTTALIILATTTLVGFTTQATTGFGAVLFSLTLASLWLPIDGLLPVLVPLSMILNGAILSRTWEHIDNDLLLKRILPAMLAGMPLGFFALASLPENELKLACGVVVVVLSLREILSDAGAMRPLGKPQLAAVIFAAGVVHGAFATGGPLVVYGVGRLDIDKQKFRSTLLALWFLLNTVLCIYYAKLGWLNGETGRTVAILIPVIALSVWLGGKLHGKLDPGKFRGWVSRILLIAGGALIVRAIASMGNGST